MGADENSKVQILLAALSERYESLRVIRSRAQDIGIWTLGLMSGASGWLVTSSVVFTPNQGALYVAGVLIGFCALRFAYIRDLSAGFKAQQRVAARIEKSLRLYEPGHFDRGADGIYPDTWGKAGTEKGRGRYFSATNLLIYIATAFLVAAIISKIGF